MSEINKGGNGEVKKDEMGRICMMPANAGHMKDQGTLICTWLQHIWDVIEARVYTMHTNAGPHIHDVCKCGV